ncbi:trichohyalin-like isoform X3 [Nerophis ophidion]|uniref:trichohyalin-like isoform X3 n=1 Tax=Nerophis ophidion TaxID=159077 RepID=UPI002ADF8AFA|nr:trichohyalin-like isoform X3 [Nerophis ophidion]
MSTQKNEVARTAEEDCCRDADRIKQKRNAIRRSARRIIDHIDSEMEKNEPDVAIMSTLREMLSTKEQSLIKLDREIELLSSLHDLELELDTSEQFKEWIILTKSRAQIMMRKKEQSGQRTKVTPLVDQMKTLEERLDKMKTLEERLDQMKTLEEHLDHMKSLEDRLDQMKTLEECLDQIKTLEERLDQTKTLKERLEQMNTLEERLDQMKTLEERLDQMKTLEECLDKMKTLEECLDKIKTLEENVDNIKTLEEKSLDQINTMEERLDKMKTLEECLGKIKTLEKRMDKMKTQEKPLAKMKILEERLDKMKAANKKEIEKITPLADKMKTLEESVDQMKHQMAEVANNKNKITRLGLIVDMLDKKAAEEAKTAVAFSATLDDEEDEIFVSSNDNQVLVYKCVMINVGDGYDNSTGVFTAPIKGLYFITLTCSVPSGKNVASVMKNNQDEMIRVYEDNKGWCLKLSVCVPGPTRLVL